MNRGSSLRTGAEWNLLSAIVESSDDAILTKDLEGTITSWNGGAERIYGYTAGEIVGKSVAVLVPPEREDEIPEILERLRRGERIHHYETVRLTRDGRKISVSLTISPLHDGDGRVVGASTIARDITERKLEESSWQLFADIRGALAWARDRTHILQDLAGMLVGDLADFCITYLLDGERILRVGAAHVEPRQERLVRQLDELAAPTLGDAGGAAAVMRTGEPALDADAEHALGAHVSNAEYRAVLASLHPISSMILPLHARGRTVGAIVLVTTSRSGRRYRKEDLALGRTLADRVAIALDNARLYAEARAELKRREAAEAELQRRYGQLHVLYEMTEAVSQAGAVEEIYEQALDGLRDALDVHRASILLFDPHGVMRFHAWRGLSDGYRAAVEGHSPWTADAVDPQPIVISSVADDADLTPDLKATILGEGIRGIAFVPLVFRGKLLGKFMLYFDEPRALDAEEVGVARTVAGTIAFAITRAQYERGIRDAKEEAERASEAKSQFLGIMSHELRTPLNAVLGYTELLLMETKGALTVGQREQLERIQVSARHQLELVEELLTYTRLEGGREEPRLITSDARRVISDVAELVHPEAEQKGLTLEVEMPGEPIMVHTDPAKLRQVALNLAGNAIKYTDAGRVSIRLGSDERQLRLDVYDTGPGIPADKLEYIFEPFARVDESRTRITSGTGLGLAIARRIATMLGGEVRVESRQGEGSTFRLRIPLGREGEG